MRTQYPHQRVQRLCALAFASLLLSHGAGTSRVHAQAPVTYAFTDVNVIPMDRERVVGHQTVIVTNGLLAAMGPVATVKVPAGATVIDGRGKFLIPGLGDAHAHLSTPGGGTAIAERALTLYALNGVTTVRSMYTEPHHLAVRDRIDRGDAFGPRTILASPALHGGSAQTPQAARDSVRKYKSEGYALIKILPGISRDVFDTLAAQARALGIPLAGHVPSSIGLERALASGYSSIEHLDGFVEAMLRPDAPTATSGFFGFGVVEAADTSQIPRLVEMTKRAGVTIVPTEFSMEIYANADSAAVWTRRPEIRYVPTVLAERWAREKDGFTRGNRVTVARAATFRSLRRRLIRELHAAGVPIALGSDGFTMFGVPGFSTFEELEIYVASGLSPFAALTASTVGVARLLQIQRVTGVIAVGNAADLVLLDANPLVNIANARRQAGVMMRGVWFPKAAIDRRLRELAAE